MSKYYLLESFEPFDWDDSALFKAPPDLGFEAYWMAGRRFEQQPKEPLEFELMETHNDQLKDMSLAEAVIMSKKLHAALVEAGVDNLDAYQTIIRHRGTGFETSDYVAVNIIGVVAATDPDGSNVVGGSADGMIDVDFDGVKIDETKAGELKMFRLAENISAIVIHESVAKHLETLDFETLRFVEPEDWVG